MRSQTNTSNSKDDWNEHWDAYAQAALDNPAQGYRRRLAMQLLEQVRAPVRLLDLGSGQGDFLAHASRRWTTAELLGVEPSSIGVAIARARVPGARSRGPRPAERSAPPGAAWLGYPCALLGGPRARRRRRWPTAGGARADGARLSLRRNRAGRPHVGLRPLHRASPPLHARITERLAHQCRLRSGARERGRIPVPEPLSTPGHRAWRAGRGRREGTWRTTP